MFPIFRLVLVFLLLILPYLIWVKQIGQTTTAYWDSGDDFCRFRGYCMVFAAATISTSIMGCCHNNNTEIE